VYPSSTVVFSTKSKKTSLVSLRFNCFIQNVSVSLRAITLLLNGSRTELGYAVEDSFTHQTLISARYRTGLGIINTNKRDQENYIGIVDFTMK
jgi:hypothetical protein